MKYDPLLLIQKFHLICICKKNLVWINKIVKFNKGYENHSKLEGGGMLFVLDVTNELLYC